MRIGGWSRLWIVITVLYGGIVAFVAYENHPRLEYLQGRWVQDASDAIADAISRAENIEVHGYQVRDKLFSEQANAQAIAYLERAATSPTEKQRLFSSEVAKINDKHRQLIAQLGTRRAENVLLSIVWWIAPSLLLMALGWSTRWVVRGFRGKPV